MDHGTIPKAIRLMESDFPMITLASAAENLFLTPNYLSHLFKSKTGKSFVEYLTEIRINEAKKLMLNTELKNYEISNMVGYQNARYFSQMFKKHVGILPNEFRSTVFYAYHKLKKMIIQGEFASSDTLYISDMSQKLETAQEMVKEALQLLDHEKLIALDSATRSFQVKLSGKDIKDVFELRELVEGYAVTAVMKTLKKSDLEALDKVLKQMDVAVEQDNAYQMIQLDMDFHEFFYMRCNNEAVMETWKSIKGTIMRYNALTNTRYTNAELRQHHTELNTVLQSGNLASIESKVIEHMQGYREYGGVLKGEAVGER